MSRSLRGRLTLSLGGAVLLAALLAGIASAWLAFAEAREFQDDLLKQVAALAETVPRSGASGSVAAVALADGESRIRVHRLPGHDSPSWYPSAGLAAGFHTIDAQGTRLRVFVRRDAGVQATIVAQPTATRDEIALDSALRTLVPLLVLLPVMGYLVVRIVRRELEPVDRLARRIDDRPGDALEPLSDEGVPREIVPFVRAIDRLLGRVRDLVGQQRRFVADAAHELRSPLAALSVQAGNLEQAGSLEEMRARTAPLRAGIERTRKLAGQLLDLARTQAGVPAATTVDPGRLARELLAELVAVAQAREVELGLDEVEPPVLRADAGTLRLVLRNALENAIRHAPAGSEVTLRLRRDGDEAVVEVVDSGPGIPADERERVFAPFHRLGGADGSGSGLGLAIAREAAARLGGHVSLHDRADGPGLVFRYRQPIGKVDRPPPGARAQV